MQERSDAISFRARRVAATTLDRHEREKQTVQGGWGDRDAAVTKSLHHAGQRAADGITGRTRCSTNSHARPTANRGLELLNQPSAISPPVGTIDQGLVGRHEEDENAPRSNTPPRPHKHWPRCLSTNTTRVMAAESGGWARATEA